MSKLATLVLVAAMMACGGSSKPAEAPVAEPPAEPTTVAPAEPEAASCEDLCTTYAGCYEEVNKSDFHGGGACVSNCEDMTPADRDSWTATVNGGDCAAMFAEPRGE